MRKRNVKGIEAEMSSGNVFADLGLRDAEKLKIKSGLVIQIIKAVRCLGLSQEEAGRRMGLPQPKVSALFRGDFAIYKPPGNRTLAGDCLYWQSRFSKSDFAPTGLFNSYFK